MGSHPEATSGDRKNLLRNESLHMDESAVWHREVDSLSERLVIFCVICTSCVVDIKSSELFQERTANWSVRTIL